MFPAREYFSALCFEVFSSSLSSLQLHCCCCSHEANRFPFMLKSRSLAKKNPEKSSSYCIATLTFLPKVGSQIFVRIEHRIQSVWRHFSLTSSQHSSSQRLKYTVERKRERKFEKLRYRLKHLLFNVRKTFATIKSYLDIENSLTAWYGISGQTDMYNLMPSWVINDSRRKAKVHQHTQLTHFLMFCVVTILPLNKSKILQVNDSNT